jgi:hypothetical protein
MVSISVYPLHTTMSSAWLMLNNHFLLNAWREKKKSKITESIFSRNPVQRLPERVIVSINVKAKFILKEYRMY